MLGEFLQSLPLFPLNTVLYPGGSLQLQIFEVRYLDMVQRCQREGTPFGVVTLRQGHEVQRAPGAGPTGDAFPGERTDLVDQLKAALAV